MLSARKAKSVTFALLHVQALARLNMAAHPCAARKRRITGVSVAVIRPVHPPHAGV
jgi:hypothetical protein